MKEDQKSSPDLQKRTDLPVYSDPPQATENSSEDTSNPIVFNAVQAFRKQGCKVVRTAKSISDRCKEFFNTGVAHAYSNYVTTVEYLHEENNFLPRIGVVSGGALLGYVLALRKGLIKRLFYATTSGAIAGSVCYPKESKEYFNESVQSSKKYLLVGYHFLNGVSKDLGGFELPALPSKILNAEPSDPPKKED